MKGFWRHPWTVAVSNILLVMALYSCMRLFCYAVNLSLFPNIDGAHLWEILYGGMRFDLTAVLYLSSLYIILMLLPLPAAWREHPGFQKWQAGVFLVPNITGICVNCFDIVYIRFTDRRTTCTFFREFAHEDGLWRVAVQGFGDYWYVVLSAIIAAVILISGMRKTTAVRPTGKTWYYIRESVLFVLSVYMTVIGIRGGFGKYTRPITISNATQYTNHPRETALVLNTPFSLIKSIEYSPYEEVHFFPDDRLEDYMSPIHAAAGQPMRTDNVVVIILESFSTEYIGFYNRDIEGYTGYTPFLDSLLAQSITYTDSYASGRKSIDAMPSVLSSIPMLIEPYIVTPYSTNAISSIAERLDRKGYETAFFHGAPNGSMGFQAYARNAAFRHYYGMDEYGHREDFDGTWAIWDEPFMQYYAQTMSALREPFMTAVFTASSHHPFRVPKQYRDSFPQGTRAIHPAIGYADHALRRFFETARKQPWFAHTLFVLTADHTNELSLPAYTNSRGLYRVPVAFYHPQTAPEQRTEVVSQTDIMPSVLGYLGYNEPYFAFGEDALTQAKTHPYAVCYNTPYYQIFSDSLLLQFDGEKTVGVYDFRTDRELVTNIADRIAPERIRPMEEYLKAYIQQYIRRMVRGELEIGNWKLEIGNWKLEIEN